MKILLITERSAWGAAAGAFLESRHVAPARIAWSAGEVFPREVSTWSGEWIVSFKSDLILPAAVLVRATRGAINFHPSPPWYRGIGGHYWALWNGDRKFGATCHHMNERIDAGRIIDVQDIAILPNDTPDTLKFRTDAACLAQFRTLLGLLLNDLPLPASDHRWGSRLYLRSDLHGTAGGGEGALDWQRSVRCRPIHPKKESFSTCRWPHACMHT